MLFCRNTVNILLYRYSIKDNINCYIVLLVQWKISRRWTLYRSADLLYAAFTSHSLICYMEVLHRQWFVYWTYWIISWQYLLYCYLLEVICYMDVLFVDSDLLTGGALCSHDLLYGGALCRMMLYDVFVDSDLLIMMPWQYLSIGGATLKTVICYLEVLFVDSDLLYGGALCRQWFVIWRCSL